MNQQQTKPVHFIGLGGAGANLVELFFKKGESGKFTVITSPVRENLPDFIHQILFETGHEYQTDELMRLPIELPETIKKCISSNEHTVLLVGLGGYTGTKLTEALSDFLVKQKAQFSVVGSLPFSFEAKRFKYVQEFLERHKQQNNFYLQSAEELCEENKHISLSDAMNLINEAVFCQWKNGQTNHFNFLQTNSMSKTDRLHQALQLFSQYADAYQKLEEFQDKNPFIIPKGDQKTGAIGEFWGLKILEKEFPEHKISLGTNHSKKGFDAIVEHVLENNETEKRYFQIKTISDYSKTGVSSKIKHSFKDGETEQKLDGLLVIFLEKNMIQGTYVLLDKENIKALDEKRIRRSNYQKNEHLKSFKFSVLSLID